MVRSLRPRTLRDEPEWVGCCARSVRTELLVAPTFLVKWGSTFGNPVFAFKKISGSNESTEILLSFLNAILGLESPYRLLDLTILDPYSAPKIKGMKDTYLDVKARDEGGKDYIIEMQVLNVAGFEKRVLYTMPARPTQGK